MDINKTIKDPYINSQGFKKLWNYFLNLEKTDEFQKQIKKIRNKYNIAIGKNKKFSEKENKLFIKDVNKLSNNYGLNYSTWWITFEFYIFENKIMEPQDTDICIISDNINDSNLSENDIKDFPISIRISPYASKRDIINYIERFFPFISSYQEKFKNEKIKIGKFKTQKINIRERNDIIYQNRHLSSRKIMGILYKKYGFNFEIDQAYIGKIISMEKKKRKEL